MGIAQFKFIDDHGFGAKICFAVEVLVPLEASFNFRIKLT